MQEKLSGLLPEQKYIDWCHIKDGKHGMTIDIQVSLISNVNRLDMDDFENMLNIKHIPIQVNSSLMDGLKQYSFYSTKSEEVEYHLSYIKNFGGYPHTLIKLRAKTKDNGKENIGPISDLVKFISSCVDVYQDRQSKLS